MAYDEDLAQRLKVAFANQPDVSEKKMFGGIAFLLSGNMCCGVVADTLMARVGPEQYETALARPHAREMDFTGRAMKGFVYVTSDGIASDGDLESWLSLCIAYAASLPPKSK